MEKTNSRVMTEHASIGLGDATENMTVLMRVTSRTVSTLGSTVHTVIRVVLKGIISVPVTTAFLKSGVAMGSRTALMERMNPNARPRTVTSPICLPVPISSVFQKVQSVMEMMTARTILMNKTVLQESLLCRVWNKAGREELHG